MPRESRITGAGNREICRGQSLLSTLSDSSGFGSAAAIAGKVKKIVATRLQKIPIAHAIPKLVSAGFRAIASEPKPLTAVNPAFTQSNPRRRIFSLVSQAFHGTESAESMCEYSAPRNTHVAGNFAQTDSRSTGSFDLLPTLWRNSTAHRLLRYWALPVLLLVYVQPNSYCVLKQNNLFQCRNFPIPGVSIFRNL